MLQSVNPSLYPTIIQHGMSRDVWGCFQRGRSLNGSRLGRSGLPLVIDRNETGLLCARAAQGLPGGDAEARFPVRRDDEGCHSHLRAVLKPFTSPRKRLSEAYLLPVMKAVLEGFPSRSAGRRPYGGHGSHDGPLTTHGPLRTVPATTSVARAVLDLAVGAKPALDILHLLGG